MGAAPFLLMALTILVPCAFALALIIASGRYLMRRQATRGVAESLAPRQSREAAVADAATMLRERFGLDQDESLHYAGAVIDRLVERAR